eukprot:Nk52_evm91s2192 gene=Nk52_evmTU91s2192
MGSDRSISFDIDHVMPEKFKTQMSRGIPLNPAQREELIQMLQDCLSQTLSENPEKVIIAGMVLVRNTHINALSSCASNKCLIVNLTGSLNLLLERVEKRSAETTHFFNPAALSKLYEVKEHLDMPHLEVDSNLFREDMVDLVCQEWYGEGVNT